MERDGRGAHHATLEDWWNLIAFVIRTTTIPLQSEHTISIYTPLHTVPTATYLWDTLGQHVLTRSDCRNWSVLQQSFMLRSVLPKDIICRG